MGRNKLLAKTLFFEVLMPIVDRVLDGLLIYHYYQAGKTWWMLTTIAAVLLPGTFECLYWLSKCRTESKRDLLKWFLFAGPLTLPFTSIVW